MLFTTWEHSSQSLIQHREQPPQLQLWWVASPVLAATIGSGMNFSGLVDPVRILLRLNEIEVGDRNV